MCILVLPVKERGHGTVRAGRRDVAERDGKGLVGFGADNRRIKEAGDIDVLQRKSDERGACLERVGAVFVMHKTVGIVDLAVPERDAVGGHGRRVRFAREIFDDREKIMAPRRIRKDVVAAADNGHAVGIDAGAVNVAIFDKNVGAADAEGVAGSVELAITHGQAADVDAGNAVVAGDEAAVFDERVNAAVKVYAVVARQRRHTAHKDVAAVVDLVHEITAALRRIAGKDNIVAVAEEQAVRAAKTLLAVRVKAVRAVDHRARLAGKGNVSLAVGGQYRPAVRCPRFIVIVMRDHLHVGAHFHALGHGKYRIVFPFVASDQFRAS